MASGSSSRAPSTMSQVSSSHILSATLPFLPFPFQQYHGRRTSSSLLPPSTADTFNETSMLTTIPVSTEFADEHPGGSKILKRYAGKNATKPFWKYHSEQVLEKYGG